MVNDVKECLLKEIQSSIKNFIYRNFAEIKKIRTKDRHFKGVPVT